MPKSLKTILVLTIVGILSGGILSLVYQKMHPQIEKQREKALREAIFKVLPEASQYEIFGDADNILYRGLDEEYKNVGYAIPASGNGYQGKIEILIGINKYLNTLKGIEILYNVETPGLGARITDRVFLKQFEGLEVTPRVEYIKNVKPTKVNQIQAITGATISTRGLINIINEKIASASKGVLK